MPCCTSRRSSPRDGAVIKFRAFIVEKDFCNLGRCLFGEAWFYCWFLHGCLIRFAAFINMQRVPRTVKIALFNWLLIMFLSVGPAKAEPPFSLTLCKPIAVMVPAPKRFWSKQTAVTQECMNKQCDEEPKELKFSFLQ